MKINYGESVINLPGNIVEKIGDAGELDLKVIIAICSGMTDEKELSELIGVTESEINSSISFWRGAGVLSISGSKGRKKITPTDGASRFYTGEDVKQQVEADEEFASLQTRCCEILEVQTFTSNEVNSLIYMKRELALDVEYILLLCTHYAGYSNVSMRFIEKMATNLHDKGIRSIEALEAFLVKDGKDHSTEMYIKKLLGLGERVLTNKERSTILTWSNEWNFSEDMLNKAYDTMMAKVSTPSIMYMNAILKNWRESNLDSIEKVEKSEEEYKASKVSKTTKTSKSQEKNKKEVGFDIDDFFEQAVARGKNSENK